MAVLYWSQNAQYLCLGDKYMRKLAMLTLASQQNRLVFLRISKPILMELLRVLVI